jgi:anthranilate phosphoribosyltransferase
LLGVGRPDLRDRVAAALAKLGTQRAAVLCGSDGLDEVTLAGRTAVSLVGEGPITTLLWTPADFGMSQCPLTTLQVDGPAASAETIRLILAGCHGPARDIVVMNSAAAIWVVHHQTDPSRSLATCADAARAAIDSGQARQLLENLASLSHSRRS